MLSKTLDKIADTIEANPEIIGRTGSVLRLNKAGEYVSAALPFDPDHTYCFLGINATIVRDGVEPKDDGFLDVRIQEQEIEGAIVSVSPYAGWLPLVDAVENGTIDGKGLVPFYRKAAEAARKEGR